MTIHTPQSLRELAKYYRKLYERLKKDFASLENQIACEGILLRNLNLAIALEDFATHLETECKDAARLDWLESYHKSTHSLGIECVEGTSDGWICQGFEYETLREAIDAAMQRETK